MHGIIHYIPCFPSNHILKIILIAPAAGTSKRDSIFALPHVRDAGIFLQLFILVFSQEKEKAVVYFIFKFC